MPTEIDPRLLEFLPFYKALFLRNNLSLRGNLTDEVAQEALLAALKEAGAIEEVKRPKRRAAARAYATVSARLKSTPM